MNSHTLIRAADDATSSLLQWGLGGVLLAVFVVPIYFGMARSAQRREDARMKAEDEDRKVRDDERKARFAREEKDAELRAHREGKLIDALVASVEQQKQALEQWRRFEESEEKTHAAILNGLAQTTQTLARIAERLAEHQQASATTAAAQTQIAQILGDVANQIQSLKRTP